VLQYAAKHLEDKADEDFAVGRIPKGTGNFSQRILTRK
jgi:hypothetical protein